MTDERLVTLLKLQSVDVAERGAFCPGDREIAAWFDGDLPDSAHQRLERHLQVCEHCLARIGLLGRLENGDEQRAVPESVLAAAKNIGAGSESKARRPVLAWATAAVLVLAVFTAVTLNRGPADGPPGQAESHVGSTQPARTLRSTAPPDARFGVAVNLPDAPLAPGTTISWSGPADPLRYELSVLSAAGDVVWTEQLATDAWVLSSAAGLAAGTEYYLRVDAVLRDGRILSSPHVPLRTAEQH